MVDIKKELEGLETFDMMIEYDPEYSQDEIFGYKNHGGEWIKASDVKKIIEAIKPTWSDKPKELRAVKVTYENDDFIVTSMASKLTDEEIYEYYKIGRAFNIGSVEDNMQAIKSVEIIK